MTDDINPSAIQDEGAALLAKPDRTAAEVAAFGERAETALKLTESRAASARAAALDPRLDSMAVAAARRAADDAAFAQARLEKLHELLAADFLALEAFEAETARAARYDAAKAQAEAVAAKAAEVYPRAAAELLGVFAAMIAATREVMAVNRDLPKGASRLEGPEGLWRRFNQCTGTMPKHPVPSVLSCALVAVDPGPNLLWPPAPAGSGGVTAEAQRTRRVDPWSSDFPTAAQAEVAAARLSNPPAVNVEPIARDDSAVAVPDLTPAARFGVKVEGRGPAADGFGVRVAS
jgi:hypothetical protein